MRLLLLFLTISTQMAFAQVETNEVSVDKFVCKIKTKQIKKVNVEFNGTRIDDESDILKVTSFYNVTIDGETFGLAGGTAVDDECAQGVRCRVVIALKTDDQIIASYANNPQKVGLLNENVKLSCILKILK